MMIIKCKAALTVLILLLFSVLAAGCGESKEAVKEATAVKVMELGKSSLTVTVDYPSKLLPSRDIDVSAKIPGKVSNAYFKVGSKVKKGDILFTLEAEESNSQLTQSEAALSGTRENIKQQLLAAETGLEQAQLRYNELKSDYEKTGKLYEQGAVSKHEKDNVETLYKNAVVSLESAKENLKIIKGTDSGGGLATAQANQAQSAVDAASIQVGNSVVRSPIDGMVSVCNVKAGELTSSVINAYTIINSDNITAEINVPGEVQSVLSAGQTIKLEIGVPGKNGFDGTIDTISPAADTRTGFYNVKIILENRAETIKPGMFAKAIIPAVTKNNIFTVPGGAIVSENGIEFVYLVQDGIVVKKIVRTGASTESVTEIEGDLKEGDRIILEGQSFLSEGEKVEAINGGKI